MSHCCVIGGTGFIGSRLVEHLSKTGRKLTVIARNPIPTRPLPAGAQYIAGDYGDKYFLRGILQGADEIINLAHTTVPQTSYQDPVQDILSNLPASVNLFEIASHLKIKKMVLVSSGGTVYGNSQFRPITEEHPTNPISPYGITKLAIEKYAFMYHHINSLPVVCVRPSNAYGEGQYPFVGQGFIASAMAAMLENKGITLYGDHGTTRDYIHVDDVVSGIAAALENGVAGSLYNIGSGVGRNNLDVIDAIMPLAKVTEQTLRINKLPFRQFDVPYNVLDSNKLSRDTGWKINIEFKQGIKRTWNWLLEWHKSKNEINTNNND